MKTFAEVRRDALHIIWERHPRMRYGHWVIGGHQCWSGRDLRGKARRYDSYKYARYVAREIWREAGGDVIPTQPYGELLAIVVAPGNPGLGYDSGDNEWWKQPSGRWASAEANLNRIMKEEKQK